MRSRSLPSRTVLSRRTWSISFTSITRKRSTLADISAAGKVSRSKCCSLFKIYMGSSPIDFVNDYRLEVSRSLLQYTDTSVADIAFNCGFTSQSYFTKLFSRTFHMTPTEFRNSTKKISI